MTLWKFVDDLTRPLTSRVGLSSQSRIGYFWQAARPTRSEARAPLPDVGEQVRLQTGGLADLGVYFALVRSVGPRKIIVEMEDAVDSTVESDDVSNVFALAHRTTVMVSYDRGEALYHFQTRVSGPQRDNMVTLSRPRQITRIQRRNYYRLPLQSPTTFRVVESERLFGASAPLAARLVNLSGGGAMLTTSKPIATGTRALVRVPSGKDGLPLDVLAESLDCRSTTNGRSSAYTVRFRFPGPPTLSQDDREAIISYIFEQQRILLRLRRLLKQSA